MADRATIDTMNKVLDNLFGTKKYAGGTPQGVGRGNPQASRDSLQDYAEELLMGGLSPQQVAQVLARTHYQMKGHGNADLGIAELTAELQKDLTRRQETLKPQMQSFRYDQRNAFVAYHAKNAALTGHTKNIEDELTRLGVTDPQEREMYKKEAYTARSTTYAFPALNRELESVQGSSKPELEKWRKSLGRIVTRDVKFDQMLHAIGVSGSMGHMIAKPIRKLIRATETGLVGQHAFNVPQSAARNYKSSPKQANLTPIKLPADPAGVTRQLAAKLVAEQRRQQAMQQASSTGQSISRSNFLKTLSRQNKPSGQASDVNLNFLGSRGTHPVNLRDKLMSSSAGRWLGSKSDQIKRIGESVGFGLGTGALGYGAFQLANIGSQAIGSFGSEIARMLMGFKSGGSVPRYGIGDKVLKSPFFNQKKFNILTSEIEKSGINKVFNLDLSKGWHDMSTTEQSTLRAIQKWKSIEYYPIKDELLHPVQRPAKKSDMYVFPLISALDKAFSTTELNYDGKFPFYHGPSIASPGLYNKEIGDVYRNPSYTAMTFNPQTAGYHMTSSQFGMDPRLETPNLSMIKYHPNGKENATYLPSLESEILFPRNMQMEITDIEDVMFPYIHRRDQNPIMKPVRMFTVDNLVHSLKGRRVYAAGGDTFNTPLASGLNSKITQDAVKRLQLLRIRAQAGNRLKGLRQDAQLNMQMGNTSLFRSPNTAKFGNFNIDPVYNESIYDFEGAGPQFLKRDFADYIKSFGREALGLFKPGTYELYPSIGSENTVNSNELQEKNKRGSHLIHNHPSGVFYLSGNDIENAFLNKAKRSSVINRYGDFSSFTISKNMNEDKFYDFLSEYSNFNDSITTKQTLKALELFYSDDKLLVNAKNEYIGKNINKIINKHELQDYFKIGNINNSEDVQHLASGGVINARVLNNLSSIFSGQKGQKFALGGDIPGFKNGTTPFNFRHFNIGRNSKYIKDMYNAASPFRNDSDGQYQMFRAIENKKMGPKDFGLLTATLKDMNPVSALSYQSDGSGIEMTDLGTHPKFQRQGFGQVLLAEMLNIGKDKGLDLATWSANSDEAAGYYNYLGAKEGENKSFTFDLNEWTGKFAKRRAFGGDTFPQQLASGPNSQISADAVKRLQLLRIRAQSGQRLSGLRDQAQLNLQLGNTSLFRSPNTAAGVINARVLRNLESRFSGQPMGKFASGGSIYGPADIPMLSGLLAPKQQAHVARTMDIAHGIFGQMGNTKLNSHVLDQAIQLHDIAKEADPAKHGNFASRFIKQSNILKGSPYESLVSFLVDKHQGTNMPKISGFGKGDQKQLKGLIPLMRIADTLSRGTFDQLPISFGKSGKMKLADVDLGLSKKKMARLQTSINAYNKYSMGYATGGATLNNPIRVSDGELAIPRGMVDKIGLSTLRRINAGDMSGLQGFSAGGMFEFDGPGTGTSDSILTDADRGPRGQDASDIGFIIRRTSSDRLKSIVGRAMGGVIPGYAGGTQDIIDTTGKGPSIDQLDAESLGNLGVKIFPGSPDDFKKSLLDAVTVGITKSGNRKFETNTGERVVNLVSDVFEKNPQLNQRDLLQAVKTYTDVTPSGLPKKNTEFYNIADSNRGSKLVGKQMEEMSIALDGALKKMGGWELPSDLDPAAVTDGQTSQTDRNKALDEDTKATKKLTDKKREESAYIDKSIKELRRMFGTGNVGRYAGQIEWQDPNKAVGAHPTDVLGMDIRASRHQNYSPSADELTSQGLLKGNFMGQLMRSFTGFWGDVGANMLGQGQASGMKTHNVATIERVVGGDYTRETERAYMERMAHESEGDVERITQRFVDEFGGIFGDRDVRNSLQFNREKKVTNHEIETGYDKNGKIMATDVRRDVDRLTVDFGALIDKARERGYNTAEVERRSQVILEPSADAQRGVQRRLIDGQGNVRDVDAIKGATKELSRFDEKVKGMAHNERLMYKFGDAMRGLSWRFASLSMSAMGVYFSIQGLMMTFQQGLGAITTPLADIEALMKNIGMSTAFGDGIMNASKAMEQLNVGRDDFIDGWKNLTNIQGTIQTLFASIGAKIFGGEKGKEFTNELLSGITDAFDELDKGGIAETVKDLMSSIVKALPAILPAIKTITDMLKVIADNPALVSMGAQLMMISLILQPVTSGLAAVVTTLGGVATISSELVSVSKALSMAAFGANSLAVGLSTALAYSIILVGVWEGIARLYEVFSNSEVAFKPSSIIGGMLNLGGFANGGEIGGTATAAVDDKTINVEEGEFVVRKDVAQKHRGELAQFNKTGVWPGSEKRAGGGFTLLPSAMVNSTGPLASFGNDLPAVQKSFEANRIAGLTEDTKDNTGKSSKVLTDVQEGDTLAVTVRNWPPSWKGQSGEGDGLPFDLGFPTINELIHGTGTMGLVNDIFNRNPNNAANNNQNTNNVNNNFNSVVNNNNNQNINNNNENQNNNENNNQNNNQNEQTNSVLDQVLKAINDLVTNNQLDINEIMKGVTTSGTNYQTVDPAFQVGMTTDPRGNRPEFNWNEIFTGVLSGAGSIVDTAIGGISGRVPGYTSPISDPIGYTQRVMYDFGFYNDDGKPYIKEDTPVRTSNYDAFMEGRYILPADASPNVPSQFKGMPMQWHMPGVEHVIMDIPQDTGEIFTGMAESGSNPYRAALDLNSAMTGNAIGAGVVGAAQKVALTTTSPIIASIARAVGIPGTLLMEGAAAVEAFTGVVAGESFNTGNKIRRGEITSSDATRGAYRNKGTGFITGNAGVSLTGKGYEVLQVRSGGVTPTDVQTGLTFSNIVKSYLPEEIMGNEQKSKEVDNLLNLIPFSNKQLLDIPLKNPMDTLMYENLGAADVTSNMFKPLGEIIMNGLKQADTNVDNSFNGAWRQLPVIGGFRSADFVEGAYGAAESLANPTMGNVVDWGAFGIGGGAVTQDLINNLSKMVSENPMSLPYLALTGGIPMAGPFLSPLMMPQTHEWMQQSGNIYQDVMPVGLTPEQAQVTQQSSMNDFSIVTMLVDAIKTNNQPQNQQPQTITIPVQITVSGEELATKGYVDVTIEREVPNVIRQNQPRIVGH